MIGGGSFPKPPTTKLMHAKVPCKLPSYNVPVPFDGLSDARYYRDGAPLADFWGLVGTESYACCHLTTCKFCWFSECSIVEYYYTLS